MKMKKLILSAAMLSSVGVFAQTAAPAAPEPESTLRTTSARSVNIATVVFLSPQ